MHKKSSLFIKLTACVFFLFSGISTLKAHEFYVSLIQISYQKSDKSLEISIKVFYDDLEKALENKFEMGNFNIGSKQENPKLDSLIALYLTETFILQTDKKKKPIYLGSENEADVKWLYLEIENIPEPKLIDLTCSFLTEVLPDQKNIIQIQLNGKTKGYLLDRKNKNLKQSFS
ncbi:MAG: DUF6702 family protein [Luteibaculaceae bacterium]